MTYCSFLKPVALIAILLTGCAVVPTKVETPELAKSRFWMGSLLNACAYLKKGYEPGYTNLYCEAERTHITFYFRDAAALDQEGSSAKGLFLSWCANTFALEGGAIGTFKILVNNATFMEGSCPPVQPIPVD